MSGTKDDPFQRLPKSVFGDFFRANLGTFIDLYAIVEHSLRQTLQHVAGVDQATGLAIFSGVKPDKAMNFIRRLYQARGETIPPELDRALQQFAIITNFRNDVLHHRVDFDHDPPITTNRASVLNEAAIRETEVRPDTLADAGNDLGVVLLILTAIMHPKIQQCADDLAWTRLQSWRYKPAAPRRKGRTKNKDRPKSQRQPRS